jgi:lysozyme
MATEKIVEKKIPKPRKSKKSSGIKWKKIALTTLYLALLGVATHYTIQWWKIREAGFAHYPGFGIQMPIGFEIHGIDVSHHQDLIKWESVREMEDNSVKLGFVFIKATEGYTRKDRQFRRNWRKAKDVGLIRGAYHFFLPNKNGLIQAQNFIRSVELEPGDLPPVVDIEETYGVKKAEIRKRLQEYLNTIERHYGVTPIIYTGADYYANYLGEDFDEYPLWVAHYLQRNKPRINRPWNFWQFAETGRVDGIISKVDFNVFSGDSAEFHALRIQ